MESCLYIHSMSPNCVESSGCTIDQMWNKWLFGEAKVDLLFKFKFEKSMPSQHQAFRLQRCSQLRLLQTSPERRRRSIATVADGTTACVPCTSLHSANYALTVLSTAPSRLLAAPQSRLHVAHISEELTNTCSTSTAPDPWTSKKRPTPLHRQLSRQEGVEHELLYIQGRPNITLKMSCARIAW